MIDTLPLASGLRDSIDGGAAPAGRMVGVGVEVVEVEEIERLAEGSELLERCFSAAELAYCRAQPLPEQHLAALLAAKEAAVKAVAALGRLAYWQVEVAASPDGRPHLRFSGLPPELAAVRADVSLSHSERTGAAVVVATRLA